MLGPSWVNDRDEGRYYFRMILPPPTPPSPDATIPNYLNDRESWASLSVVGFWRPPPPPQTPQYLTI